MRSCAQTMLLVLAFAAVSGCADALRHSDTVTFSTGWAQVANRDLQAAR